MIIKPADDKTTQLAVLRSLRERQDVAPETREKIEVEIRNIQAGIRGEKESAYEIDFHFGASPYWMVIHDLRMEFEGRVAQIDHLVISRFLDCWVCESKHFSEGLTINEYGECSAFYDGKEYGIASPMEQNRKHISVLESAFKTGAVKLPTRLGIVIPPKFHNLILVSKNARITRPKTKMADLDNVIKNDQIKSRIWQYLDDDNNPLGLAKLITSETLEAFARSLATQHQPIEFDWHAKFGLPKAAHSIESEASAKQKNWCAACKDTISNDEAIFCWSNKKKFGGKAYCRKCQKLF